MPGEEGYSGLHQVLEHWRRCFECQFQMPNNCYTAWRIAFAKEKIVFRALRHLSNITKGRRGYSLWPPPPGIGPTLVPPRGTNPSVWWKTMGTGHESGLYRRKVLIHQDYPLMSENIYLPYIIVELQSVRWFLADVSSFFFTQTLPFVHLAWLKYLKPSTTPPSWHDLVDSYQKNIHKTIKKTIGFPGKSPSFSIFFLCRPAWFSPLRGQAMKTVAEPNTDWFSTRWKKGKRLRGAGHWEVFVEKA